jgi:CheY-like chemotaxis protein
VWRRGHTNDPVDYQRSNLDDSPVGRDRAGGNKMTSASILIVEDETLIRMMTAEMVEELGHRVVGQASKVSDGLILAKTAEFNLAILDINIGGYSVAPVAEIIEGRGIPILFCTGYATTGMRAPFHDRRVLRKPFQLLSLQQAIDAALSLAG